MIKKYNTLTYQIIARLVNEHIIARPIILTYLFGALEIKNSFTVFDPLILLIAGRTKGFRGLHRPGLESSHQNK